MSQRYVLYPGPVCDGVDGQLHFISASALTRMYGVDMRDCMVFEPSPHNRAENYEGCIHLRPYRDENSARPAIVALRSCCATQGS